MTTTQTQKEREMDMAWERHRNPSNRRIPTEQEIWERKEREMNRGKF